MYFDYHYGIFGELYSLIDRFIFSYAIEQYVNGNLPGMTAAQFANIDLVATLIATLGTIFLIAIPFIVVIFVIKAFLNW